MNYSYNSSLAGNQIGYNGLLENTPAGPLVWLVLLQWIVSLPLLDSCEKFKLIVSSIFTSLLVIIAVSRKTPEQQMYCPTVDACNHSEEVNLILILIHFTLRVFSTVLWSILWMRWTIACKYFTLDRSTYNLQRYGPICLFVCLIATLISNGLLTHVSLFTAGVILFLWFTTGSYFMGRLVANPFLLLLPVFILTGLECVKSSLVSSVSSAYSSSNVIECFLVSLSSLLLVCALDKSRCIQDLFTKRYPVYCSYQRYNLIPIIKQTFLALIDDEIDQDQSIFDDFNVCLKILKHHCETLTVSLPFYTSSARIDVTIAYAFIRVSDDLVDDGRLNMSQRLENHQIVLKFMDQLFSSRDEKWTYDVGQPIDPRNEPSIDWTFYKSKLPYEAYQVFRAYSRTVYYQPGCPMKDLVSTYSMDLEEKHIANERELIEFSHCAGGGIMATFHIIQLYKSGLYPNGLSPRERPLVDTFYSIGQAMQLVNIARDIALDSSTDGRCYIPTAFMENPEKEVELLTRSKDPWALGLEKLSKYSKLIVALSYHCCAKASLTLDLMPSQVKKPLMIFSEIYRTIGSKILKHSGFERRIFVPLYSKMWIALSYLYFNRKHI